MAFTLQDDTGTVSGANAYISVSEYKSYWADRGIDLSAVATADAEAAIVKATQYIDTRFEYYGLPLNGRDQTTQFPRQYLYDSWGNSIDGIPREVKNACAEYAYYDGTVTLSQTITSSEQGVTKKRDKVDVLEEERTYSSSSGSSSTWNIYQIADAILSNSGFVVTQWTVGRA